MRVDVIELLRCPVAHDPSPLITVAIRRDGEHLLEATLGCVVCGAEYALHAGVLYLRDEATPIVAVGDASSSAAALMAMRNSSASSTPDWSDNPDADVAEATRIAALLNLSDSTVRALLCGRSIAVASAVETLTGARCVSADPRDLFAVSDTFVDVLCMAPSGRIPLADQSLHGVSLSGVHVSLLADVTRVVRRGGRVVAPASAPLPRGCRELARDNYEWVAEVEATSSPPIRLSRA